MTTSHDPRNLSRDDGGPTGERPLSEYWMSIRGKLRDEFGDNAYASWLKPLQLQGQDGNCVRMSTKTRFMRDWIQSHYMPRLNELWRSAHPSIRDVEITISHDTGAQDGVASNGTGNGAGSGPAAAGQKSPAPRSSDFGAPYGSPRAVRPAGRAPAPEDRTRSTLDARYRFENFVVGKPNELAYAAAQRVADSPTVPFNPLFLYGGVGLGKTHLMNAIAWKIKERAPERRVIYLSAENFMQEMIRALRHKDTMRFKERFRSVDVLMVDDVQFFIGKDSTQEEFFHTFNDLVDRSKQLVVSADKSPSDLGGLEERLRSRLGWGLVADIHPMTYELRHGVLQQKADAIGIAMPEDVIEFIAHRITSNARELEGALNKLVAHATMVGRDLNINMAQEVLRDLLRANDRKITVDEIKKVVCAHFNIRLSDMESARRSRAVARPRQIAMYFAKQLTAKSLPELGRLFGGRDHTTVMYAIRKVEELSATDQAFEEDIDILGKKLER